MFVICIVTGILLHFYLGIVECSCGAYTALLCELCNHIAFSLAVLSGN